MPGNGITQACSATSRHRTPRATRHVELTARAWEVRPQFFEPKDLLRLVGICTLHALEPNQVRPLCPLRGARAR
eukprot:1593-Rhodomonas_salina.1